MFCPQFGAHWSFPSWADKQIQKQRDLGYRKWMPVSVLLPVFCCINPASAFQHQVQYGTAGHGLLLYCPALLVSNNAVVKTCGWCESHWSFFCTVDLQICSSVHPNFDLSELKNLVINRIGKKIKIIKHMAFHVTIKDCLSIVVSGDYHLAWKY